MPIPSSGIRALQICFIAALALPPGGVQAGVANFDLRFSIDAFSTENGTTITPADVLAPGPNVAISGAAMGLERDFAGGFFDELNAVSSNAVRDGGVGVRHARDLLFSVERFSTGASGSAVAAQAATHRPGGDVFGTLPGSYTNRLMVEAQTLGLTTDGLGADLDALDAYAGSALAGAQSLYFSIGWDSASNGFGAGGLASDIFFSGLGGNSSTFFDLEDLGFDALDDLDALILADAGQTGVADAGDFALFSLSALSPSTFTASGTSYAAGVLGQLSPADVLWTDFSDFGLWRPAAALGLESTDELNALTIPVPAPVTLQLILLGIPALWGLGRSRFCG